LRQLVEPGQYVGTFFSKRLAKAGIEPTVGCKVDSGDNALAETIKGLFKADLVHRRAPWKTKQSVELARLEWVAWLNNAACSRPPATYRLHKLKQTTTANSPVTPRR